MAEACPNCGALKNWMEDIQRCMDCGYMGDPETARLRAAVADLAEALRWAFPLAEIAMEVHRQKRLLNGHFDIGANTEKVGLWPHEQEQIQQARTFLAKHAPLIAECKAEKEG